ncbi:hypothetical protein KFL_000750350 [Klebsormidium nitens]|uniref:Uncharacterized protein n=1 Tax=Klebsormidium nitens TaxID=105231 RepID=A0A0U9HN07_KLENI|nr:hypothetical protein KFL_000750350 [Klebsormidium nitens]|eukprot:GAQ81267.1 hypothetical protein KFL_000750350 [Klebsormidium nitens]
MLCKQFWEALPALEILEWEIDNADAEQDFLQSMRDKREGLQLKRLALNVAHPSKMQGILQAVTPPARETLEEVYLFLGDKDEEAWADWHSILSLLQECKTLEVLHLAIWAAASPTSGKRVLWQSDQIPPKPFPALRSLTLFGFSFMGDIGTLLQCFPLLESLELFHLEGQNYNLGSTPLKKFYSWGRGDLGFDVRSQALARVPSSLAMLPGFLRSASFAKAAAASILLQLKVDGTKGSAMGRVETYLQQQLDLMVNGNGLSQWTALKLVGALLTAHRKAWADVPGLLEALVAVLKFPPHLQQVGAVALLQVTHDGEARIAIAKVPGVFHNLLAGLDCLACLRVLHRLAQDEGNLCTIKDTPGCVEEVEALLDEGGVDALDRGLHSQNEREELRTFLTEFVATDGAVAE